MAKRFTAPYSCSKPQSTQESVGQAKNKGVYTRHLNPNFVVEGIAVVEGRVLGKKATVLRYPGSDTTIVRTALVPGNCLGGKNRYVRLLDGSGKSLQELVIQFETPYFTGEVTAA